MAGCIRPGGSSLAPLVPNGALEADLMAAHGIDGLLEIGQVVEVK